MQQYFHHLIAISTFMMSLLVNTPQGGGYLTTAVANQHTEVSTPFMHARQFLYLHPTLPFNSALKLVNSILFFLTYFFGRFIFQVRLAYEFFKWLSTEYTT